MAIFLFIRLKKYEKALKNEIDFRYETSLNLVISIQGLLRKTKSLGVYFPFDEFIIKNYEKILMKSYGDWIDRTKKLKIE